jgi:hypothetical protein
VSSRFKPQSVHACQDKKRDLDPKMNAVVRRYRFGPKEQEAAYEHQGKPDERHRHHLLPDFRDTLISQS